jgi:hypothetical protein
MGSNPFYKKWWFVLLVAPIMVGIFVVLFQYFLPTNGNAEKVTTKEGTAINVEGDINVGGDFVSGDKHEYNLDNPIIYQKLESKYADHVKYQLNELKKKYPDVNIHILINAINPNDGMNRFLDEFKTIMEYSGIPTRVVPETWIGGSQQKFPMYFKYKGLNSELVMDYMMTLDKFFSHKNGQIIIPKPINDRKIPEGFNIVIKFLKNAHFDKTGQVFFN